MLMVLPVLPLLALSGHVTVDGVTAAATDEQVTVTVATSAPVGDGDLRSKLTNGVLQLYLDGGHVHGDRTRNFKSGAFAVSVLKRNEYAKVEVPLAAELGCAGPVAMTATDKGFTASVGCKSTGAADERATEEPAAAKPVATKIEAKAVETKPAAKTETKTEAKPEVKTVETKPVAEPTPAAKPAEAPASATAATPPAITLASAAPNSGSNALMFPLLLLVGAGGAAFYFKKRQQKQTSLIQILETAQLGPKRQLVVAKVNGETMVLGSSEAGITCLTGQFRVPGEGTLASFPNLAALAAAPAAAAPMAAPSPAPAAVAPQQFVPFDPPAPTKSSGNEFVDEGGLLTKLFRARGQEKPAEKVESFENIELHEFDNLLQESIADQELRRKLSSGLRGKVS